MKNAWGKLFFAYVVILVLFMLSCCSALAASGTVVYENVTTSAALSVDAGKTLTMQLKGDNYFNSGISVPKGSTLIIEGDGSLTAQGIGFWGIGIGAENGGTIIINSGTITAAGGTYGYAIGGDNFEKIIVNGGTIIANGSNMSTTFGGDNTSGGYIEINGGSITVNSANSNGIYCGDNGTIVINNGIVNVSGDYPTAGIGGGANSKIIINEGSVTSQGRGNEGAAIGGGSGNSVTINGGTVIAECATVLGSGGAAIGGGQNHIVTINGGTVSAKSGYYGASIGGNAGVAGGTININGGNINVIGSTNDGAAIGGGQNANGGNVTISGGTLVAKWGTRYRDYYPDLIGKGYGGSSSGTLTVSPAAYTQIEAKSGSSASQLSVLEGSPFLNKTSEESKYEINDLISNTDTYVSFNSSPIYVPRITAYIELGRYAILAKERFNVLLQFKVNEELTKPLSGYSVTISDPQILKLDKTEISEDNYVFTFSGLKQGTTLITFTENETKCEIEFPIEVIEPCNYYTCENFLKTQQYEMVGTRLLISEFRCSTQNNKHNISFYAFNNSHAYGAVGVFDKNGDFITCTPIKPWASVGSGFEILFNGEYYLMVLLDDDPWYERFAKLSEFTKIELTVPEDAEIVVTLDGKDDRLGKYISFYSGIDYYLRIALAAKSIIMPTSLDEATILTIAEELQNSLTETAFEELITDIAFILTKGLTKESITEIYQLISNTFGEIAKEAGAADANKYFSELLVKAGIDLGETIVELVLPPTKIFSLAGDVLEIAMIAYHYIGGFSSPELEIDVREHTRFKNSLTDHSITVIQEDYFNIETVLDAYLVIENQELLQFPALLTADMLTHCIYSITLRENGKEIQPNGEITVRIPVPKGADGEKCVVYCLETDNTRTNMNAILDGEYMVFKTSHLSYYLIGEPREVEPNVLNGKVDIAGNAVYGQTLTASVSDTNNTGTLTYTWKRDGIIIATSETYTLTKEDIGKSLTCEVTSSIETGSIAGATAVVAKQAGTAAPTNLTGVAPTGFTTKDGKIVGTTADMELAADSSFTSSVDCGNGETTGLTAGTYYIRYKETDTAYAGEAVMVTVPEFIPNTLTGTITIAGNAVYGETLTASVSNTNNTGVLTYTWQRDSSDVATGESYTLTGQDIGKSLTCEVTSSIETGSIAGTTAVVAKQAGPAAPTNLTGVAPTGFTTKDGKIVGTTVEMELAADSSFTSSVDCGNGETTGLVAGTCYIRYKETDTAYAGEVAAVTVPGFVPNTLTGTVAITGNAVYGQMLTASVSDTNNSGVLTYSWKRDGSVVATGASYTLAANDVGKMIICEVTSSVETGSIAGATEIVAKQSGPAAPTGLTGVAPTSSASDDGKIIGTTEEMEYALSKDFSDAKSCGDGKTISLVPGTYYVRIRETSTTEAGEYVIVVISEYVRNIPVIQYPENDQTVNVEIGNTANMSVMADHAVSYQWFVDRNDGKGFVEISGATSAVYTTAAVKAENDGYCYFCRVSNADGYVDSPMFTLQVIQTVNLPDTGDHSRWMLWMMVAALSIVVIKLMSRKQRIE